ncbi:hypothetical protein HGD85_02800 [Rhodobacteraceae bacterium R_SAG10]|nr:hypothetical protein [Rhodobacteraceae bacterium R_SAG10]
MSFKQRLSSAEKKADIGHHVIFRQQCQFTDIQAVVYGQFQKCRSLIIWKCGHSPVVAPRQKVFT